MLYHAKIHPEQYSNTLSSGQIAELHSAIHYVCSTSVDLLGDAEQFPTDWLFHHRWGKGKKNQSQILPNGDKVIFLTVGGRTSAVVPAVQKKTSPVKKDVSEEVSEEEQDDQEEPAAESPAKRGKRVGKDSGSLPQSQQTKNPVVKKQHAKKELKSNETDAHDSQTMDGRKRKVASKKGSEDNTKAKKLKSTASPAVKTPLRRGRSAAKK